MYLLIARDENGNPFTISYPRDKNELRVELDAAIRLGYDESNVEIYKIEHEIKFKINKTFEIFNL